MSETTNASALSSAPRLRESPTPSASAAARTAHDAYLFPSVKPYYDEPLVLRRGSGVRVEDAEGEEYLDLFAGILTTSIGHAHPEVVARVREQVGTLGHTSTLYVTEPQIAAARRLAELAPAGLTRTFFTNSGTEAVETAIMAARMHTGRTEVVALRHAYSGRSHLATTITAHGPWRPAPGPAAGVVHARSPYAYRCPFRRPCDASCIDRWIDDLVEVIETTTTGRPAALMFEPVQGVGGYIVLPDEYVRRAAEVIRSYGGLLISDEVQTGFGRTGGRWWGIEHGGVAPDLMVMAKGIANGFPVGATMATEEVALSWGVKTISTFGGNPVCMAAADATLEVMTREDVPARAAARGAQLRASLEELQARYPWMGEVRGRGLMQAIEVVRVEGEGGVAPSGADGGAGATPPADPARARGLLEAAREQRLLLGLGGLRGNVVRMGPSLLISEAEVDEALQRLARACAAVDGAA